MVDREMPGTRHTATGGSGNHVPPAHQPDSMFEVLAPSTPARVTPGGPRDGRRVRRSTEVPRGSSAEVPTTAGRHAETDLTTRKPSAGRTAHRREPLLMRSYLSALAGTTCAVALLAGCTGVSATSAAPPSSSDSGVPGVKTPLSTGRYQQSPCDALTQAQVDDFLGRGASPQREPNSPVPTCGWVAPSDSKAGIRVIFGQQGISRIYDGKGTSFKFFVPLGDIEGYPAAAYDAADNRKTEGDCTVEVGTSDTSSIDVGATVLKQNIGKKDPCLAAYRVARTIISNIKGND